MGHKPVPKDKDVVTNFSDFEALNFINIPIMPLREDFKCGDNY